MTFVAHTQAYAACDQAFNDTHNHNKGVGIMTKVAILIAMYIKQIYLSTIRTFNYKTILSYYMLFLSKPDNF